MNTPSKFYSSLFLLIVLNVLIKPVWIFGIDRQVQNTVGLISYGTYFSLLNFSIVLSFLLDWGLTGYFNRQTAAQQHTTTYFFTGLLSLKLLFAVLYSCIVFGMAYLSGVREWELLSYLVLLQIATSFYLFLRAKITGEQLFKTDAYLSVLDKFLMLVFCGSILLFPSFFGRLTVLYFLKIQLFSIAVAVLVAGGILYKLQFLETISFRLVISKKDLFAALPFGFIVLLMGMHYRLDAFLLERLHPDGAYEAGVYAGAYRLLDASNMVGYLVASFLLPFIAKQQAQLKMMTTVIINSRHLLLFFSILMAAIGIVLAPWLQQLLYNAHTPGAIQVMQFCLPVLIAYSLIQIYGTVMTAMGKVVHFCFIVAAAVVVNVFLNLLLIPVCGALGCSIAALFSQGACGIATLMYCHRKLKIHIHIRSLLIYTFTAGLLISLLFIGNNYISNKWLLIVGLLPLLLGIAVVFKLVDFKKWKEILQLSNTN